MSHERRMDAYGCKRQHIYTKKVWNVRGAINNSAKRRKRDRGKGEEVIMGRPS